MMRAATVRVSDSTITGNSANDRRWRRRRRAEGPSRSPAAPSTTTTRSSPGSPSRRRQRPTPGAAPWRCSATSPLASAARRSTTTAQRWVGRACTAGRPHGRGRRRRRQPSAGYNWVMGSSGGGILTGSRLARGALVGAPREHRDPGGGFASDGHGRGHRHRDRGQRRGRRGTAAAGRPRCSSPDHRSRCNANVTGPVGGLGRVAAHGPGLGDRRERVGRVRWWSRRQTRRTRAQHDDRRQRRTERPGDLLHGEPAPRALDGGRERRRDHAHERDGARLRDGVRRRRLRRPRTDRLRGLQRRRRRRLRDGGPDRPRRCRRPRARAARPQRRADAQPGAAVGFAAAEPDPGRRRSLHRHRPAGVRATPERCLRRRRGRGAGRQRESARP